MGFFFPKPFCESFLNTAFQNEIYSKCAFMGSSKCVQFLYRSENVNFLILLKIKSSSLVAFILTAELSAVPLLWKHNSFFGTWPPKCHFPSFLLPLSLLCTLSQSLKTSLLISPFSLALKITTEAHCASLFLIASALSSFLFYVATLLSLLIFFFFFHSLPLTYEFISFHLIRLPKGQHKILEWVYVSAFGNSNECVTMVFRYRLVYSITLSNRYSSP